MDPVHLFLLTIAAIFVIGVVGELVFERTQVPDVIWLIVAGVLLGPVFGVVEREPLLRVAPYFGAITLVIVLFDGGTSLRLGELARAAPRSAVLALLSFSLSVAAVAAVTMAAAGLGLLPASWSWLHGLIAGAILGGSSSVVIMPAVARARLEPGLANLVNLESALTDVLCIVCTGALITVSVTGAASAGEVAATLGRSFAIAAAAGGVAGMAWILIHRAIDGSEHEYPVTLGALLLLYVATDRAGGSPAFAILAAAVIIGNARGISARIGMARPVELGRAMHAFHDRLTFIVKSFFFTFIGVMLAPPLVLIALGAVLGVTLALARVPAVHAALLGTGRPADEKKLVTVLLPRGMAAGVLALMPHYAGVPGTETLPVAVFACVVTTVLIFAGGFPIVRSRLAAVSAASVGAVAGTAAAGAATGAAGPGAEPGPGETTGAPPASG